ncbi:MAG: T9SS type A sorting domain-containing protein [Bacteroidetes bacterium]|nr:T9SS type A sorting domain-containing protein [Bacteroidota bacterium]
MKSKLLLLSFSILTLFSNLKAQQADCNNMYLDADTFYLHYLDDTIVEGNLFYNDTVWSVYPFIHIILEDTTIITTEDFMVLSSLDSGYVQFFNFDINFKTELYPNNTPVSAFFHIYDSDWPGDSIVNCYLPITLMLENFTTSIENETITDNYTLFPNPMTNTATLQFENDFKENCIFMMYNLNGELINSITDITGNTIEISKNNLINGLYFFQVSVSGKLKSSGKLMIE